MARPLRPTLIRFGRFGDMVMLTALATALHHRFGAPCQVVGAGPWNRDVFRAHPDVSRAWSLPRHLPFALTPAWPQVLVALHRTHPAPIYVCEPHDRQLARVKRLLRSGGIATSRCLFITELPPLPAEHCIDRLLRFGSQTPASVRALTSAGPALDSRPYAPCLRVLPEERAARDAWLAGKGWLADELVLVQAGNFRSMSGNHESAQRKAADDKAWPAARWAALLREVQARLPRARILLCGAASEVPMLEELRMQVGLERVAVVAPPLRALFALCEAAHSMISVDTGPAHAAAALGVPLVVLYGAESPAYWLPRGPASTPVTGLGGPPRSTRVDQLSVGEVFDAWSALPARHDREVATEAPALAARTAHSA
ncbi:MAG: glycosyltransferase family 9 protein [Proteobacteria bacterium]|nr:glycosyltransferase family 9 protein [Pseudomonadota bacterium]